jgi:hypothetical protein
MRPPFPRRAAIAAALLALSRTLDAQIFTVPGTERDGRIVAKVNVTLFDRETRYHPVAAHRLAFVRTEGDSVTEDSLFVTTDEAGTVVALVPEGTYLLASVRAVEWKGQLYHWTVPVEVRPGIDVIDLVPSNSSPGDPPRRVVRAAADTAPAPARPLPPQRFAFAEIPWGAGADSVRRLMRAQGLEALPSTEHGAALRFGGTVHGLPAEVEVSMRGDSAARVEVILRPAEGAVRRAYDNVRAVIGGKYGLPAASVLAVQPPYDDAERDAEAAVREGRGRLESRWVRRSGEEEETLVVRVTPALEVRVVYESALWQRAR